MMSMCFFLFSDEWRIMACSWHLKAKRRVEGPVCVTFSLSLSFSLFLYLSLSIYGSLSHREIYAIPAILDTYQHFYCYRALMLLMKFNSTCNMHFNYVIISYTFHFFSHEMSRINSCDINKENSKYYVIRRITLFVFSMRMVMRLFYG